MKNITNSQYFGLLILFILWPFGSFLIAIQHFYKKEAKLIVYMFIVLFGLTFVLGNELLDSYRYAEYFEYAATLTINDLGLILGTLFASEGSLDLARPLLSFIVSRFTSDYHIFFGVIAAIFGYFYLKSINLVYQDYRKTRTYIALIFLLFFILIINPIFHINAYRFWTATWIFFYGAHKLIILKEKKYLFLILLSITFHFSFIAPALVLITYMILGNRNKLYIILIILSFFVSGIILNMFPQLISIFGEGIADKAGRYANPERMQQLAEHAEWAKTQGKWYLYLPDKLTFYFLTFSFFYLHFKNKKIEKSAVQNNLYSFSLLLLAFANTISFIPSMGRFKTLFLLFGTSSILSVIAFVDLKKTRWLFFVGILPFFLSLITVLRLGVDLLNPLLFTMLPFPFLFDEVSIYQWLFK